MVNNTSLLEVVGRWFENPDENSNDKLGWPFSSFNLIMFEKTPPLFSYSVTLADQQNATSVEKRFLCKQRVHTFIFWEWFFNSSVGYVSTTVDFGSGVQGTTSSFLPGRIGASMMNEMLSSSFCYNQTQQVWTTGWDELNYRRDSLPSLDPCSDSSAYVQCNDVEILGNIQGLSLTLKLDLRLDDIIFLLPHAVIIALIALLEHSAVVKILSVDQPVSMS